MKSLTTLEYEWLSAASNHNLERALEIEDKLDNSNLFLRGLYTAEDHPDEPSCFDINTFCLTQAGKDAMMCYRVLHMNIQV
jgi:hypothetical protein